MKNPRSGMTITSPDAPALSGIREGQGRAYRPWRMKLDVHHERFDRVRVGQLSIGPMPHAEADLPGSSI